MYPFICFQTKKSLHCCWQALLPLTLKDYRKRWRNFAKDVFFTRIPCHWTSLDLLCRCCHEQWNIPKQEAIHHSENSVVISEAIIVFLSWNTSLKLLRRDCIDFAVNLLADRGKKRRKQIFNRNAEWRLNSHLTDVWHPWLASNLPWYAFHLFSSLFFLVQLLWFFFNLKWTDYKQIARQKNTFKAATNYARIKQKG